MPIRVFDGDGSYGTERTLSDEKFSWRANDEIVDIGYLSFGCSDDTTIGILSANDSEVLGLGRNAISFVSQLRYKRFAYCLVPDEQGSENSTIYFGSHALIFGEQTPLVKGNEDYYFLTLQGISVGNKEVLLPNWIFNITEDGDDGFFIDSGTAYSLLRGSTQCFNGGLD